MEYVTYAPDGSLTGSYNQDLAPEHVDCYIEASDDQRQNWTQYQANSARTGLVAKEAPSTPSLAQLVSMRCAQSDAFAAEKRNSYVAGTSPAEMASWPIKLAEAVKFAASGVSSDAPYLSAEAAARGMTLSALVAKVQTNGAQLAGMEAQIAGVNGRHKDALAAMADVSAVAAYDITAGYPA